MSNKTAITVVIGIVVLAIAFIVGAGIQVANNQTPQPPEATALPPIPSADELRQQAWEHIQASEDTWSYPEAQYETQLAIAKLLLAQQLDGGN
jgi:hypothetical protein